MNSSLSRFQLRVAEAFFEREQRYFLTGGAALAGFLLGHRATKDLDLFSTEPLISEGDAALRAAAAALGGTLENLITSTTFRRYVLKGKDDSVVIDLVHDQAPQGPDPKLRFGSIVVDPPREILANKLCALLSRAEIRDLVDVYALEKAGYHLEDVLPLAQRKDGGLTPAQLGWVLSEIRLGDDAQVPGAQSVGELRAFLAELLVRLGTMGYPKPDT